MQIRKAKREKSRIRLGLIGPSGSGKTLSALLIAYGLAGDWEKIGVIDTENRSADLYAGAEKGGVRIGEFLKIDLTPPYTPDKYVQAIKVFENAGVDVIIIDSLSHAWTGEGGLLDLQGQAAAKVGNSFAAWREVTPKHNRLVETMLSSSAHVIATLRAKAEYVIDQDDKGRKTVRKVGLAPIQRDGIEYEFDIVLDIGHDHSASVSKDRTSLFDGEYFVPSAETGQKIAEWIVGAKDEKDTIPAETTVEPVEPVDPANTAEFEVFKVIDIEKSTSPKGIPYARLNLLSEDGEIIVGMARDEAYGILEGVSPGTEIHAKIADINGFNKIEEVIVFDLEKVGDQNG